MLLDIGVIIGERRMCWSGEWDHWEYLVIQVTIYLTGSLLADVFYRLCEGEH